jgi:hypothetical protein
MDDDQEFPEVELGNLNDGVAGEFFKQMMEKVKENVLDPNTSWKAKREIVLKVVFKPNEERDRCKVIVTPSVKLAAVDGHEGKIAIGFQSGVLTAKIIPASEQEALPFTPKPTLIKAAGQ